jgi:hypothetical protein
MIERTTITGVEGVVMEVDLARYIFWLLSHLSVRQNADPSNRKSADTMKSSTGPLSTRFPRIDGHTKSIDSPILFLAGFIF